MKDQITRRDFLKILSGLGATAFFGGITGRLATSQENSTKKMGQQAAGQRPNIIFILFDAMSAWHLSLYGYTRKTSPNLERFASKAITYNQHRSAGLYTTPSGGSLFTGTYPWTHRALTYGSRVLPRLADHNLFRLLHGTYNQLAFTQNLFVDTLLYQFGKNIDDHEKLDKFTSSGKVAFNKVFAKDAFYGSKSFDQFLFKSGEVHGSLFLSLINDLRGEAGRNLAETKQANAYPYGLPYLPALDHTYFALSDVMDGVISLIGKAASPSFSYFHFLSPHEPYKPTSAYFGLFHDNWTPPAKPKHALSGGIPEDYLNAARQTYDQYVANTDAEFGRLMDHLEKNGFMENSYIIVTSDHGELFERGVVGHGSPLAYESGIRIPLLIHTPGQQAQQNILTPTSTVDLFPTLLHIAGLPIPDYAEGLILPGLGGPNAPDRSIFVVDAKENSEFTKIKKGTLALIKDNYKLIHTIGYREQYADYYEFYDLGSDPDEFHNQFDKHPMAKYLKEELDSKLNQVNQGYA